MWLLKNLIEINFKKKRKKKEEVPLKLPKSKTADLKVYIFQFISLWKKKTLQSRMLINTFESLLKVNEFSSSLWDSPSIKLQAHFAFPFKSPIKGASPPMQRRASL